MEKIINNIKCPKCNSNNIKEISDIVFDPFVGAGATCVKAYQMNRRYLGIELNEQFANIAINRFKSML